MTPLLLALLLPAEAARHELSFEYTATIHDDPVTWDVGDFGANDGYGLRGGYAVLRDRRRTGLVITGAWSHASRDADVELPPEDGAYSGAEVDARWRFDTIALGAKADIDVANVFYPYVHVQAALITSSLRVEDTWWGDEDEGVDGSGLAPAGLFTAGFELMIPDRRNRWPVTAALFVDAGYQVAGPLTYGELGGDVDLSGPVIRTGIGLRM